MSGTRSEMKRRQDRNDSDDESMASFTTISLHEDHDGNDDEASDNMQDIISLSLVNKRTRAIVLDFFPRNVNITWCKVPSFVHMLVNYPDLALKITSLTIKDDDDDINTPLMMAPIEMIFLHACKPIVLGIGLDHLACVEWTWDLVAGKARGIFAIIFALLTGATTVDLQSSHLWRFDFLNVLFKSQTNGLSIQHQPASWIGHEYLDTIFTTRCKIITHLKLPQEWTTYEIESSLSTPPPDPMHQQIPAVSFSMFTNLTHLSVPEAAFFPITDVTNHTIPLEETSFINFNDPNILLPLAPAGPPFTHDLRALFPPTLQHLTITNVAFEAQFYRRKYRILEFLDFLLKSIAATHGPALPALKKLSVKYKQVFPETLLTNLDFSTGIMFNMDNMINEWNRYAGMQEELHDEARGLGCVLKFGPAWTDGW